MLKVKEKNETITEEFLLTLIGNYVYVPTNLLTVVKNNEEVVENIWFGGQVAGYEVSKIWYSFKENEYQEEPKMTYSIVMVDGASYILSESSEIFTLTEEEFKNLLTDYIISQQ